MAFFFNVLKKERNNESSASGHCNNHDNDCTFSTQKLSHMKEKKKRLGIIIPLQKRQQKAKLPPTVDAKPTSAVKCKALQKRLRLKKKTCLIKPCKFKDRRD